MPAFLPKPLDQVRPAARVDNPAFFERRQFTAWRGGAARLRGKGKVDPGIQIVHVGLAQTRQYLAIAHPAVYIMILPAMGVVSEVVATFSRKEIFGYKFVAAASLAIAVYGFLVWGHHMFVSGQSVYAGLVFSVLSYLVAIPSAVKVFNWTATLYKGKIWFQTPLRGEEPRCRAALLRYWRLAPVSTRNSQAAKIFFSTALFWV